MTGHHERLVEFTAMTSIHPFQGVNILQGLS
jgi:hypothetical protein